MALRVLIAIAMVVTFLHVKPAIAEDDLFLIGIGDVLVIEVYNEKELSLKAQVGQSGSLKIPLIGEYLVIDRTTNVLAAELEAAFLDGYLVNPSVTVRIEKFRPFYIKGAVKSSGSYDFQYNLSVDQAIAIAGGLKDRASKTNWYIVRGPQQKRIKASKTTEVLPGDIIEIEESIF